MMLFACLIGQGVCVVVLDYTCYLGWEGRNTNSYPAISIFEMILWRRDRETETQRDREAGCDVCGERYVESGRRGEAGREEEDTKFLDLNRSKRSVVRGECRAKAADLAESARAG
jgi:hypothetical protein